MYSNKAKNRLTAQWIGEITDILMYKIVSYLNVSVVKKNCPCVVRKEPHYFVDITISSNDELLQYGCLLAYLQL